MGGITFASRGLVISGKYHHISARFVSICRIPVAAALAVWCLVGFAGDAARAQFTTVINSPPTYFGNNASIGSDTQLNIFEFGETSYEFRAGEIDGSSTNVEVNLFDGSISDQFRANGGSVVNVFGGFVRSNFTARAGSEVNFSGGSIADRLTLDPGAAVKLIGNDFRLDDVPVTGLETIGSMVTVDLWMDFQPHHLSGTLADGTPFAFYTYYDDQIETPITLESAALPAVGPAVIQVPADQPPKGVRAGQTVILGEGGGLPYGFQAGYGSEVVINGGYVGNFEATGAEVTITSGNVGSSSDAFYGTTVQISGGEVGGQFHAAIGSTVNITGGRVGSGLLSTGGAISLSGGYVGDGIGMYGGALDVFGRDFRVNGEPIAGLSSVGDSLQFDPPAGAIVSGILQDGSPFAFNRLDVDVFYSGSLTLHTTAIPAAAPVHFDVPIQEAPRYVREGQSIVVRSGGSLNEDFTAARDSTLVIDGGTVGYNLEAVGSRVALIGGMIGDHADMLAGTIVDIRGGTVGHWFEVDESTAYISGGSIKPYMQAGPGSVVNISGGFIDRDFSAHHGSKVVISGGSIGEFFSISADDAVLSGGQIGDKARINFNGGLSLVGGQLGNNIIAWGGSVTNIAGGQVGSTFSAEDGSVVNISGGTIGDRFLAFGKSVVGNQGGSTINVFGTQFVLNGVDITSLLASGVPFTILDRNVLLSGVLAEGSAFDFLLNSSINTPHDYFSPTAELTVTLVDFLPGDFNRDSVVDAADYTVWRNSLGSTVAGGAGADGNFDGRITQGDYFVWKTHFGQTAGSGSASVASTPAVPEPTGLLLAFAAAITAQLTSLRAGRTKCA